MRSAGVFIVLAIFVGSTAAGDLPATISSGELAERLSVEPPAILDVRTRDEFARGHVPGALNIPVKELRARLREVLPLKAQELVVYCEAGPRAQLAYRGLSGAGFARLRLLKGHMRGWREAGLPIE